jgi:ATP-dependent Clp protease adaptor protein ClpS
VRLPREAPAGMGGPLGRTMTETVARPRQEQETQGMPPYNVVLLDDEDHSYEYVILMLKKVFGHPVKRGYEMAVEVDTRGRVVVLTTHLEEAELKRDQIHAFGPDPLIPRSKGSMSAIVEPANA